MLGAFIRLHDWELLQFFILMEKNIVRNDIYGIYFFKESPWPLWRSMLKALNLWVEPFFHPRAESSGDSPLNPGQNHAHDVFLIQL
jgi:hypothetical protein